MPCSLQSLLNEHAEAISAILRSGKTDRYAIAAIRSHFRQSLALVLMTAGVGAKVPHLLLSVAAESVEANKSGCAIDFRSIREDDLRIRNDPWYNVPEPPEHLWMVKVQENSAYFAKLSKRAQEVESCYMKLLREGQVSEESGSSSGDD